MSNKIGNFESIEAAREFFKGDRFATESGIMIEELEPGRSVCSFEISKHHLNAEGGLMGGATFTLIDFAFATASSCIHRPTVAMQVSVNYLNAVKGKKLIYGVIAAAIYFQKQNAKRTAGLPVSIL